MDSLTLKRYNLFQKLNNRTTTQRFSSKKISFGQNKG